VLDAMRRIPQGAQQLAQALSDFEEGRAIRAVDENGAVMQRADGSGDQLITDVYLRTQFPPPGKVKARSGGETPTEKLQTALASLSDAMESMQAAFNDVRAVHGNDGMALVDADGVDGRVCREWRQRLAEVSDELSFWGRTYRRRHGAPVVPSGGADDDEGDGEERVAEVDDVYGTSYDGWEDEASTERPSSTAAAHDTPI
jgi:hypothetical protein